MSSHHTHERAAILLQGVIGAYIILFDGGHANNVFPQTKEWGIYGFSLMENALETPLKYAHYCEGGMSKGKNGNTITGEYHINQWRKAVTSAKHVPRGMTIKLEFAPVPSWRESALYKHALVLQIAANMGCELVRERDDSIQKVDIEFQLDNPQHVDVLWAITRDHSDASADDHYKRLIFPSDLFTRSFSSGVLGYSVRDTNDVAVKTVKSTFKLRHDLIAFDVPEPEINYGRRLLLVRDWTGKIVSLDPLSWFCSQLHSIEQGMPGSAESAYRNFKAELAALKVRNFDDVTLEVAAATLEQLASMGTWYLRQYQELSKNCLNPPCMNFYPETLAFKCSALKLAGFVDCNMYVDGLDNPQVTKAEPPLQNELLFAA